MLTFNLLPWREIAMAKRKKWQRYFMLMGAGMLWVSFTALHEQQQKEWEWLQQKIEDKKIVLQQEDIPALLRGLHDQSTRLCEIIHLLTHNALLSLERITLDQQKIIIEGKVTDLNALHQWVAHASETVGTTISIQALKKETSGENLYVELVMLLKRLPGHDE